jgi:hypothetical protein
LEAPVGGWSLHPAVSPRGRVKVAAAAIECRSSPSGGKGFPVKKFLLLLIVVALGAAVAYKVRGDA